MRQRWLAMPLRPVCDVDGRSGAAPASHDKAVDTVTGRYSYIPNPCTTDPCLPGMAYALFVDGTYYFITREHQWLSDAISREGYAPEVGDLVTVTGRVRQREDRAGNTFYTVEVTSIRPAS